MLPRCIDNLAAKVPDTNPMHLGHLVEAPRAARIFEGKAGIDAGLNTSGNQFDQSLVVGLRHRASLVVFQP